MNICFYTDTFLPKVGGAEVVLDHLARELTRRGKSVVVFAPDVRGAKQGSRAEANYGYPVLRYRKPFSKRFGVMQTLPWLMRLHARYRFDVIHCHAAYPPAFVASAARKWIGVPVVVRPHGSDILPGERIRKHARLERRVRRTLQGADAVIAQGQFLRDVVLDLGVDATRVHTIHNGVDLSAFAAGKKYAHPRPYCLGLGNLSQRKGFDVLLRAYALLRDPSHDLIIAGTGPEHESLQSLASDLGIRERVRFVGHVSGQTKVDLYRSADFFICPSRREPFANVLLEALASGLPIVATEVGGNPELVRHEQQGLLCPSDDPHALASAIQRMTADSKLAARLRAGATRFVQDFDWPAIAAQYLSLYESVVARRAQKVA